MAFRLKTPFASFPINLVMGIVQDGSGAANARSPIGTGPYKLVSFKPDDRIVARPASTSYFEGPAKNSGVVLKVVPDDTMRGLELRKGAVDLVVNDVVARHRLADAARGEAADRDRRPAPTTRTSRST